MPASSRTTGLIVAVVLLVVFAGVVTFFVVRTPGGGSGQNVLSGPAPTPDPALVPAQGPANRAGAGQGFYIQVVDKDDPTAVRAELSAERSRPIEGQTYRVALEKPVIWAFLKDGRTIYARADQGTAYIPDQSKGMGARPSMPQDGVMEGNVVVRIFDAREGNLRPNPEEDEALLVGRTPLLKFDSELGQAEAPQRVNVTARGVEFEGAGVTVILNEAQQRVELVHIAHTDHVTFNPGLLEKEGKAKEPRKAAPAGVPAKPAAQGGAEFQPAKKPVETLYRMVCTDSVSVTQGTRTITSDQLEGWARLVGNQLRPGAVMMSNAGPRVIPATQGAPSGGGRPAGAASGDVAAARTPDSQLLTTDPDTPVTLAWKGPLEVRPVAGKAAELDFNDVFVRFTSRSAAGVNFRDSKAKATATGNLLEYGATRREVALAGAGARGARIALEGAGHAAAERFDMSLVTGIARVNGEALLTGVAPEGGKERTFAWKKEGQFQFAKDGKGEVTQQLTKVTASGATRASDGSGALSGETLVAAFAPVDAERSRVDALTVVGRARAEDGKGGSLDADRLDVAFVPVPGRAEESDPRTVVAQGSVKGRRSEGGEVSTLEASWLQAAIGRVNNSAGRPELTATKIDAKEAVFTRNDGLRARAPQLAADPVAGVARLTGSAGTVSVGNPDSTITGQDMTFQDAERRLVAAGPGTMTHDAKETAERPAEHLAASWTRELTFDDLQGVATITGEALAELSRSRGGVLAERDTMKAEEVVLALTPGSRGESGQDRKLLRATITGTLESRADGKPASVESRLFAAPAAGANQPVVERMMYLESARILADDEKSTLEVPRPGKLLFVDRRAAERAAPEKVLENPQNARGTALFTWSGSMNLERDRGVATLRENVNLKHQPLGEGQKSELECEVLVATVREERGTRAAEPGSFSGELVSADAEGAVWMSYAGRELVADKAHYDAVNRTLRALALGDNRVQVFGGDAPAGNAKDITWDLAKDTIEITKPGAVTAPRR